MGSFSVEEKAVSLDFPDAAALFFVTVFSGVNDESVSGSERNVRLLPYIQPALAAGGDDARIGSAFFAVAAVSQARMVRSVQPA